ncbi:MAG TPA: FtsX-like permease family protein [Rhizomicrobium sp.]|jgi:putative ABC transport system permease protein|nr:FtsX-like permease family protein [Rhizomicrobium sp.]
MKMFVSAWRLARRELRSGLSGFRIFFASLVLGVAAIAAVGSFAQALLAGLADNGRVILGGDVAIELVHRSLTSKERAFVQSRGATSQIVSMRAMAYALADTSRAAPTNCLSSSATALHPGEPAIVRGNNGNKRASSGTSPCYPGAAPSRAVTNVGMTPTEPVLIELKAVDSSWPLYGSAGLKPARTLSSALACASDMICGALADRSLLDRLHLIRGGSMRIGKQNFRVTAVLTNEPDRLSGGFSLGPHVIISADALARTGLVALGSLIDYTTRVRLRPDVSIAAFRHEAKARFPDAGWQIHDRDHAAPGTDRFINQLSVFLTLTGLTALAVGGVGAGQAVRAFLDRKREEIATLKALGADGGLVFLVFFLQVMAIAALASFAGVILGGATPFVVGRFYGAGIPVPARFDVFAAPLLLAFVFGMLSAAAFAIPPLARAREIAPAGLFRDLVAPARSRGRLPYLAAATFAGLAVVVLALVTSPSVSFSLWFIVCAAGGLVTLALAANAIRLVLGRLPQVSQPGLRLTLTNMTRPGSSTAAIITALGLGLSLLATITIIDRTISHGVNESLPGTAPTFYFIDIQPSDTAAFDRTITSFGSVRDYRRTPMIRGRIVALNGVPAARAKVQNSARWAISGDRGITYAAREPRDTQLTAGRWWPANYHGPTLISFDNELARGMGLKLGDTLTLNVLGREIEGRIANFRDVDFSTGRQNFILILSPGLIDKAPHSFLATVQVAPRDEDAMYRAVTGRFPSVSTVRVREVIAELDTLLEKLAFGVRAASLITILAGLLVLAGAVTAGLRTRLYESTVMKVMGATRQQIARVHLLEYAIIGALTGTLALGAGTAAATLVTRRVFDVPPVIDWSAVILTVAGGAILTVALGLALTWTALAAKPAQQLRNL